MSVKIKNRHRLKDKDIKDIIDKLKNKYSSEFFSLKSSIEIGNLQDFKVIFVDGDIDFMIIGENIVITLRGLLKYKPKEYFVVVDMGAVGFVVKGADVMTPGIVDVDFRIKKDDYVWVCDENHRKPISVGIALMSGEEMKNKDNGKAIKNIHYIGDKLWSLSEN